MDFILNSIFKTDNHYLAIFKAIYFYIVKLLAFVLDIFFACCRCLTLSLWNFFECNLVIFCCINLTNASDTMHAYHVPDGASGKCI